MSAPPNPTTPPKVANSVPLTLDGTLDDWGSPPGRMRWVPPDLAAAVRDEIIKAGRVGGGKHIATARRLLRRRAERSRKRQPATQ